MKGKLYTNPRTQGEVLNVAKTASQLIVTDNKITASVAGVEAYVQSRGQNLVSNGNGLLGTNKNFTGFTFDAQQNYAGGGSFFSADQNAYKENDELIPVDPNLNYRMSLMAKSKTGLGKYYFGVSMFDVDGLSISPSMVNGSTRPVMQLAAELKAGDTTITLTGTDGFEDAYFSESSGHRHSIIFWGYKNSKGYTYPDSTYSRLYGNAMWNDGGINRTTNVITLNKPWTLTNPNDPQGIWRVGQKVSGTKSGGSYQYIAASNENVPLDWKKFEGLIGGPGVGGNNFFPGTAFIRMIFLINRSTSGGVAGDNLWINSVDFANIKAEDNAKVYTNSVITQTKNEINLRVSKTLLGLDDEELKKINFKNKVSGSTVAVPHYMKASGSASLLSVQVPSSGNLFEVNGGGNAYPQVSELDNSVYTTSIATNGAVAQQLFYFDLIEHVQRTYGITIKGTLAEKVSWLKTNVSRVAVNWYGTGSNTGGNRVSLMEWLADTSKWAGQENASWVATHTNASISKLSKALTVSRAVDANGFVCLVAYAESSNGTVASVVSTDFVELEVTLKTNEAFRRITSAETNIKQTSDKLELTARAVYAQKDYRIRYIRDWLFGSNMNNSNHWVQVQAFKDGVNLALNKPVSASTSNDTNYPFSNVTNGNTSSSSYGASSSNGGVAQYVTVDLGAVVVGIENIKIHHYYYDGRTYNGTKTEVSEDGVTWYALFDSAISGKYVETSEGKTIYVNSQEAIRKAESKITQTSNKISLVVSDTNDVRGDQLVSAINLTNSDITIAAEKVNIKGKISFDYFDSTIKKVVSTGESDIMNPNGNFLDWSSSYPEGWQAGSTAIPTKVTSDNNTGYAAQYSIGPTQTAGWIIQDVRNTPLYDYVTVEVTFKLVSGTIDGSGILFRQMGAGGETVQDYHVNLRQIYPTPTLGKWYTVTKILKRTVSTNFGKYRIHMMGAWTSFAATPTEKVIQFDSIKTWPSSEAEIKAYESEILTTNWKSPNTTTIDGGKITTNSIDVTTLKAGTIDAGKITISSATAGITINNSGVVANNAITGVNVTMNSTTGFEIKRNGGTVFTVNTDGTLYAKGLVIDGGTISWGTGTGKVSPPSASQVGAATPGDVSSAVSAIQVGGTNLLQNSTFNLGNWGINTNYGTVIAPEYDKPSSKIFKMDYLNATGIGTPVYADTRFYLNPKVGDTLTFSLDLYCDDYATNGPKGNITTMRRFDNPTGGSYVQSVTSLSRSDYGISETNGVWQRGTYTFTFSAGNAVAGWYCFGMYLQNQANVRLTFKMRELQVEYGNKATAWTPAPEDINAQVKTVETKVTEVDSRLDTKINKIQVGARNLFKLSSFKDKKESEPATLNSFGGNVANGMFTSDTPPNLTGRSLRIQVTTAGTGGSYYDTDEFTLEEGKEYTVSYYAKASSSVTVNGYILALNRISDNNYITGSGANLTSTWQRFSYTFTVGAGQGGVYRRRTIFYVVGTFFVANVQLEEGNKMSAWSYNPEEIYSDISNIAVGGTNYVPLLGGNEYDLNSLYGTDKNYATVVTLSGKKWIQFTGQTMLRIMQISGLEIGSEYTWSFNAYTLGTGTLIRTNQWGSGGYNYTNHLIGNTPKKLSVTFKAQGTTEILHMGSMTASDTYLFSDFQLEKGNRNTDYSPAFSQFASFTATNDALALRVTSEQYSADKTISGTSSDFKIARTNLSTSGWYRFATNAGDRASAKFTLVDVTGGRHATATFYASINYGNFPKVTLINFSRYSSAPFTKVRILKASTYDPPFLEVFVPNTATLEVYCAENVQSRGWTAINLTAGSIPSGYTALEFSIDENNVADSTSQNVAKDTANVNGQAVGTFVGRVTNTETGITTLNGQITSKVTQTDINNTLKAIKVGGGNILYNSSALLTEPISNDPEETQTRLRGWEDSTIAEQIDNRVAFKLSTTAATSLMRRSNFMSIKANTTYTVGSWVKATANSKGVKIYVLASNVERRNDEITYDTVLLGRMDTTTDWTYEERSFTTGPMNIGAYVRIDNMGSTNGLESTVWISEIQIQEGEKNTRWEPSYKDSMVSVYDLEERIKTAEFNVSSDRIFANVSESVEYNAAMQALLTNAQNGMISGSALEEALKDERVETQKAIQEIDFTPYALASEFEQTRDKFAFNIKSSGGVNLIKNSVGFGGIDDWELPATLLTGASWRAVVGDDSIVALGSGAAWELKNIELIQRVKLVPEMDYTISFLALKSAGKQGFEFQYSLDDGASWTVGATVLTENEYAWEMFSFRIRATSGVVGVKLKSLGEDTDCLITNVMMNLGTEAFQWQSAPDEVYNTSVSFNRNGIVVRSSTDAGETRMTPKEFAGYYPDESGILQPIFQLSADVTKVQKLELSGEMRMGDILVREIRNDKNKGWAFLKNG